MDVKTLKSKDSKIKTQIAKLKKNGKEPIGDGIINFEGWTKSEIKILWLLKEAYDNEGDGKGNWSLTEILDRDDVYEYFLEPSRSKTTWYPIIYTSYGILKGYKCYDDIPFIQDQPKELTSILGSIAFININKLAGKSVSSRSELKKIFGQNEQILKEQIALYNPDVIIGCGTLGDYYKKMFGLDALVQNISKGETDFYIKDKKQLCINAYHPGWWGIPEKKYVDDLISIYRQSHKKLRSY